MMFKTGPKKDQLSRYTDPTGEFSNQNLKMGEWYVRNKLILEKIGIVVLLIFCIITVAYSLWGWGYYAAVGYWRDKASLEEQARQFVDVEAVRALYTTTPLQISRPDVFRVADTRYDFSALVGNPNARHIAKVTFHFGYSGGETKSQTVAVLPGQEARLSILGHELPDYPVDTQLVVTEMEWSRIDPHEVAEADGFIASRVNFVVQDLVFAEAGGATGVGAHRLSFSLTNDSAYSYWDPTFIIELIDRGQVAGIAYLVTEKFKAGETRAVELRLFGDLVDVSDIRLLPILNVFDPSVYMAPAT